jgi:alpha-D-ribose 1-methylphosphonate 5-triphosphate synthase subunit PhnH
MASTSKIPWTRLIAEGGAIVISILLAFAIEAWWADRQVRLEEKVALSQLQVEFETNARLLNEKRQTHQAIYDAARYLLELTASEIGSSTDLARVANSVMLISEIRTFDAEVGALSSLISSGKLGILQSNELRSSLAAWPALISDLSEDEMGTWSYTDASILPYLDSRSSVRELMAESPDYAEWLNPGHGRNSAEIDDLIQDREFENLVVEKLKFERIIISGYDELEYQVTIILQQINDELSKHR